MKHPTRCEQLPRPRGLEAQKLRQLRARPIERCDAEPPPVLAREVHAAELEIPRHVLEEVDELQARADLVARRHELRVAVQMQQPEHQPPDRIGGVPAVLAQVVPRLVVRVALVDPVGLDQPQKRLARERELTDGRLEDAHHRPGGLAGVTGFELALQLVQRGRPIAFDLITEDVHEPREAIDRAKVPPQPPREEQRGHGEVLRPRSAGDGSHVHP